MDYSQRRIQVMTRDSSVVAVVVGLNLAAWLIDIPRMTIPGLESLIRWGLYAIIPIALMFHTTINALTRSPIIWIFGLFVLVNVLSAALTYVGAPAAVAYALRTTLLFLLLPLVRYSSATSRDSLEFVVLVCATVALLSLVTSELVSDAAVQHRLRGLTPHPNILGFACSLAIAGLLGRVRFSSINGVLIALIVISLCWTVVLTQSGIALITVVVLIASKAVAALASAVGARDASRRLPGHLIWVGAVACAIPPVLAFGLPARGIIDLLGGDLANIERVYAWKHSATVFTTHPIFGGGVSTSLDVVSEGYQRAGTLLYSHSVVLHHLRTTGLVGASALTLALGAAMIAIGRASAKTAIGATTAYMAFAVLMFSAVEAGLQGSQASWIVLYVLCGTVLTGAQPILKEGPLLRRTPNGTHRTAPQEARTAR